MPIDLDLEFKDYYSEDAYMVADVETGVLYNRSGRRMLALTDDFLIGFHRAIEKECGARTPAVLHTCGRRWGNNFGTGLAAEWSEFYGRSFREFPTALFQSLLIQEFANNGWGLLELNYEHYRAGIIVVSLKGAIMSAINANESSGMADLLTAGILAGMYSYFLGRELDCMQTQGASLEFDVSRFVISSAPRISKLRLLDPSKMHHDELVGALIKTTDAD
jgi:predicted hydrocarbon binding protein